MWLQLLVGGARADGVDPGAVTDPMRLWAEERAGDTGPPEERLKRLLGALREPDFGLVYDDAWTGTAEDVFRTRRYNCLSLTILFVSLARDLGLDADYLRVDRETSYSRQGDLVVVTGHVTAGFGPPARRQIAEIGVDPDTEHLRVVPLSDEEVLASWWTNQSAERLRAGAPLEAVQAAETALALLPTLPEAWVNLGVALRHSGDWGGAEHAYREALRLDPHRPSAWRNLGMLYRLQGRPDTARELLDLADRPGHRDPYTLLVLGDWCVQGGDLDGAGVFYRRAHTQSPADAEILAALGELALAREEVVLARRWSRRATAADPADRRAEALAARLRDY